MSIQILKDKNKFNITIKNNLKDLIFIRKIIELWLDKHDINEFKIMTVKLCLEEAIYNGMVHAYKNIKNPKKVIDGCIEKTKNLIKIKIQDYGKKEWYSKFKMPDPEEESENHKTRGRGLLIMNRLANNLKIINKKNKGTIVEIQINLADESILAHI